MKVTQWDGCYDESWKGLIVPLAFGHPAKFSPGLIKRIFEHCLEQGYCSRGDLVVDPFGGIGGGGIFAAPMGLRWVGCELEPKFVELSNANFALHSHAWEVMGYPMPVILQGDSRELSRVLEEADLVCTSPPFCNSINRQGEWCKSIDPQKNEYPQNRSEEYLKRNRETEHYGQTPGQIGNMKGGSVDAVVTSPPWENNIEGGVRTHKFKNPSDYANHPHPGHYASPAARLKAMQKQDDIVYGDSDGNIGNEKTTSYFTAVADVYRECHKILKPGGVIVIVVKAYIKKGRRVHLPMQTLKLLIHLGFTPLERIKAMLVKESVTDGLFGEITKVTERKSFFRRLHEKRFPNLKINYEEILICRK